MMNDFKHARDRMVRDIASRGIRDQAVLTAMRAVPRHLFVEQALASQAYDDRPQPIGFGQTISQPYIVARMTELLEVQPGMKVLEVGTGSGYQAAVLAEMGAEVYTVERIRELFSRTRDLLGRLGYYKVRPRLDDGTLGWPAEAPFERIIVTAGGPEIPAPLVAQLADPGRMVMPVGGRRASQDLTLVVKQGGKVLQQRKDAVVFVELIGRHGF